MFNIPNTLTMLRMFLVPVFVVVFYLPYDWAGIAAASVFAVAAVTDWLDGYLARRLQQQSKFGAFLDPVADKIMVAVALIVVLQHDPRMLVMLPVIVIIGREITISALREWMAELGERTTVEVSNMGKFKTAAQMLAIIMMVYADPVADLSIYIAGIVLLYVASVLTFWSMYIYLKAAWPTLSDNS